MYAVSAFEEFAENRVKRRNEFWYGWAYDYACSGTYWAFISFKLSLINNYLLPALKLRYQQQQPIINPNPPAVYRITRFRFIRYVQYSLNIRQRRQPQHQHQQQIQQQHQQRLRQQQQQQIQQQHQQQIQQQHQQRLRQQQQQQEIHRQRLRQLQLQRQYRQRQEHRQHLQYLQELLHQS